MRLLALLLTFAVIAAPLASGEPTLTVDRVVAGGDLHERGDLAGVSLIGTAGGLQTLRASAETAVTYRYATEGVFVAPGVCDPVPTDPLCKGTGTQSSPRPSQERYPTAGEYRNIDLTAVASQAEFNIHVFPLGDAKFEARMPASTQYPLQDACLDPLGIRSLAAGCDGFDAERRQLSAVPLGQHTVVTNASLGADAVIIGDLVLELRGVTLQAGESGETWSSGDDSASAPAGTYERSILRVVLTGATLQVSYGEGLMETEWVLEGGQVTATESTVLLHEPRGFLDVGAGKHLDGGTERITGDFHLTPEPTPEGMGLGVEDAAPSSTAGSPPVAPPGVLWGLMAALAVVALGAIALARRRVSMQHVEKALSQGRYGRAARLSQRLLRRDPFQESAHLSRAIAWARGGSPSRVVPAVQAYLEEHEPHDGALHYVLGLAYQDLGDDGAARDAMAEAATRTPALLDEMAPDLRPRPAGGDGYT